MPGVPVRATMAFLLTLALGLLSAQGARAHGEAEELFEEATVALIPYEESPTIALDGTVSNSEYGDYGAWMDEDSGFSANYLRDDDSLYVALSNPGSGWIALGFSADLDEGMGFIVIGAASGSLRAEERFASNISDEMAFSLPETSSSDTIEGVNLSQQSEKIVAEVRLSLASSLWTLEPGVLTPTVVAFNDTSPEFPEGVEGSEVHFLRSYILRAQDDPAEIERLFAAQISPIPDLIAIASIGAGVMAVLVAFVRRREGD